jgi:lysophospholipase L1-like esterase
VTGILRGVRSRATSGLGRLVAAGLLALLSGAALLLPSGAGGASPAAAAGSTPAHLVDGRTVVTILGDSWTVGLGATDHVGYAQRALAVLGWNWRNLGVSGSGYSVPGAYGSEYEERIDEVAASRPDVVVVQGSLNERSSTPARLREAAERTLTELREEVDPTVPIVVVGASYNPGTPDATIDWINAAISAAAADAGLSFVDAAQEGWTDPDDPSQWSDVIHPNDRGYELIAERMVPLLRSLVRDRGARGPR